MKNGILFLLAWMLVLGFALPPALTQAATPVSVETALGAPNARLLSQTIQALTLLVTELRARLTDPAKPLTAPQQAALNQTLVSIQNILVGIRGTVVTLENRANALSVAPSPGPTSLSLGGPAISSLESGSAIPTPGQVSPLKVQPVETNIGNSNPLPNPQPAAVATTANSSTLWWFLGIALLILAAFAYWLFSPRENEPTKIVDSTTSPPTNYFN